MTTIVVYAPIRTSELGSQMGKPEYSYAFVLDHFRPVLEQLGTVVQVTDPSTEVDPIYDAARAAGDDCVFLSFAPPHRSPVGLRCPTSSVFAWEFDTIPDEVWGGDSRHDWRTVLADHGRAIVLSQHSVAAVKRSMGTDFPVRAIPTPVFDRYSRPAEAAHQLALEPRSLSVAGRLIDSRDFEFTDEGLQAPRLVERLTMQRWDGRPFDMSFTLNDEERGSLVGFYLSEPWGTWSRVVDPWLVLPCAVQGSVEVTIVARGQGLNADRKITATLGSATRTFVLPRRRRAITLRFDVAEPASVLQFRGLAAGIIPEQRDERTMGIGLARISVRRPNPVPARLAHGIRRRRQRNAPQMSFTPTPTEETLTLDGVAYTTVFNPVDARKNWEILLYAFCWAFRDEPRATLVLKVTHHSLASFFANLQFYLHRIGPVACRVVAVHGYLADDSYAALVDGTTYYVNASAAEGLCMPLMEFMSAGAPAIAPNHTAMADYVTGDAAFLVRSTLDVSSWPHDERQLLRARHHRIDWQSLADAFEASFAVATEDPARYAAMSSAAQARQQDFSSDKVVAAALTDFLGLDAGK